MEQQSRYLGLRPDELGPTRSELADLVARMHLSEVAKLYSVDCFNVRDWCKIFRIRITRKKQGVAR